MIFRQLFDGILRPRSDRPEPRMFDVAIPANMRMGLCAL